MATNASTHFVCFFFLVKFKLVYWKAKSNESQCTNDGCMCNCALCTIVKRIIIIDECFKF